MSALIPLLHAIVGAATHREPLGPALRELGEDDLADAIERGTDLPTALGERLDPRYRELLAGPRPGLEETALFVADDLLRRRHQREALIARLIHPAATWVCLLAVCGSFLVWQDMRPDPNWCIAAVMASLAALLPLVLLPDSGSARRADRYARAALACRWRLPEERLTALLGDDLRPIATLLARPAAEDHLRLLADFHRRRAERRRRFLLLLSAIVLYAAGGLLLLATAYDPLSESLAEVMRSCADL